MDNLSYLQRLPVELWSEIFSRLLIVSPLRRADAPSPLCGTHSDNGDLKTVQSLALTCTTFYRIAAPLLADHVYLRSMGPFSTPGMLQRTAFDDASRPYVPSTLVIAAPRRVLSGDIPHQAHPSLRAVKHLGISKPWLVGNASFPDYVEGLSITIGTCVQEVFILPSSEMWFVEDIVVVALAFSHIERMHIGDLRYYDGFDSDDELDPNLFSVPGGVLGPDDSEGYQLLLEGLNLSSCPRLKRLDILQYVGPLCSLLSRFDSALDSLCLSSSALKHYSSSIISCPSLLSLHIIVDCVPDFYSLSLATTTSISVYLPSATWSFVGVASPYDIQCILHRTLGPFFVSDLPSLRTLSLYSEVPLPRRYIQNLRFALSRKHFEFRYIAM